MRSVEKVANSLSWHERPLQELVRLSLPITVSMLSYSAMTLVDTWLVGRLGAEQLAGVGLGGTIAFTLVSFGFGLVRGGKTLVSQATGAGKRTEAGAYLGAMMLGGVLFGLLAILLQWPLGLALARSAATVAQGHYFVTYLLVRSLGAPSAMLCNALREARYGQGDSRSPMVATLIANAANIVLGWLFVFTWGWGVAGAAWATVIAQSIEAAVLVVYQHRIGWGISAMRRSHLVALFRVGVPTGLQQMLEIGSFAVLAAMIASMSPAQMAAHQITLQLISFSFLPAFAIGEAASVMVGQAVGAVRDDLVPRIARLALLVVSAFTGFCTLALLAFASALVASFTKDAITQQVAMKLVYVSCVFLVIDGVNIVARAVLRGAGDVVFPAWLGVLCSWGLTPPLAWLLGFHFHLGAFGGWLGLSAEVLIGASAQWLRLARGGWRPYAVRTRAEMMAAAADARGA